MNRQAHGAAPDDTHPVALPDISASVIGREKSNIEQLDMLLGDGFVPGSSVLLIGPPGAGKSTLLMQIVKSLNSPSLYVTGEESVQQLKLRADRLDMHAGNVFLLFETNINRIAAHVETMGFHVLIIDSIQTVYTDTSGSLPGTPAQIRKSTAILRRLAHRNNLILIIAGQVTKDRKAAGPKLLEHAVDVVLYLESDGNQKHQRMLHASKNRYGSTEPRCTLIMRNTGLVFLPVTPADIRI